MKCNYYGYYFVEHSTGRKIRLNIKPLVDAFLSGASMELRNSFSIGDEKLYLIPHFDDVYFFIMTRDKDLMKAVNIDSLTVSQISELLNDRQQLGFSSYLVLKEDHFGLASSMFAPRVEALGVFMSRLLQLIGAEEYRFYVRPMMRELTKADAANLSFIGRTTIEVSRPHELGQHVLGFLGLDPEQHDDISSLEITVKPRKKKDIKSEVLTVLDNIPDEHVKKLVVRARDEVGSQLSDLYLDQKGALSDAIIKGSEAEIAAQLAEKLNRNQHLHVKLQEFRGDDDIDEAEVDIFNHYADSSAWSTVAD